MTLIWNELLQANFRCGRMCRSRAEKQALSQSSGVPSGLQMCQRM